MGIKDTQKLKPCLLLQTMIRLQAKTITEQSTSLFSWVDEACIQKKTGKHLPIVGQIMQRIWNITV